METRVITAKREICLANSNRRAGQLCNTQKHIRHLPIMTEREVTLEMTLSFECRIPIPRNPVFTRLHMIIM